MSEIAQVVVYKMGGLAIIPSCCKMRLPKKSLSPKAVIIDNAELSADPRNDKGAGDITARGKFFHLFSTENSIPIGFMEEAIGVALIPAIRRDKPRGRRAKIGKLLEICRRAKGLWLKGANSFLKEGRRIDKFPSYVSGWRSSFVRRCSLHLP